MREMSADEQALHLVALAKQIPSRRFLLPCDPCALPDQNLRFARET